ncbi:hypothetical protein FRC04_007397 [Tulasnella sp. 424]|nr:hypothetical protein FRC04_007397 [Tulasnella sp. 424]KAG8962689.1 hypothetical protein FRC05_005145 [Tulasnella sp. 425]
MSYMSPPPTPPQTTPLNSAPPTPSAASTSFRLPAQPTILLKAPSEETIARLRQLAPYYWSHPQTTNCAIHFPIDPKQQARIQAYQARQRQAAVAAHQSRSRAGSVAADHHPGHARRPSLTPPTPSSTCSPTPTSSPPQSISRQSSAHRLRAVHSGSGLAISAARQSILGSGGGTPEPPSLLESASKRRGSITPGYDPFSRAGTSFVSQPSSPTPFGLSSPSGRRESVPVTPSAQQNTLSVPSTPDILRRGSAPVSGANKNLTPMRTVRLHVEYLTAQSALIRQVLAEAAGYIPPVNASSDSLATPPPDSPPSSSASSPTNPFPHSFFRFSPHRYPRVIYPKSTPSSTPSSTPTPQQQAAASQKGPIIVLPVPDPQSFPLLIHYMYHGKMDAIERTLREGQVSWEGLVRNVEYLGLRDDVKRYLGKWWKNWRDAEARRARGGASGAVAEDDEEDEDNDEGDDEDGNGRRAYPYPSAKDLKMDVDGDDSSGVGDWTERASANAAGGELVDEMAGLLDRF